MKTQLLRSIAVHLALARKVKTSLFVAILLLILATSNPLHASSITVSGIISTNTTWSGIDTVKVTGNITINNGVTLTINPGIKVVFQGFYSVNVQGCLLAIGTSSQMIKFTALNQSNGWNRIILNNPFDTNDSTKIVYCHMEYGKATGSAPNSYGGCMYVYSFNKVLIFHSTFQNNSSEARGGALYCESSNISIRACNFQNNSASSFGGAMYLRNGNPILKNNLIQNNTCINTAGILFYNSDAVVLNNTISNNNGEGIRCIGDADPVFTNTIIINNSATEIYLQDENCDPDFYYCDCPVPEGLGAGANYSGVQQNCMSVAPGFLGSGNHPFDLSSSSPCINSGNPATNTNDIGQTDLSGDFRIMNGRIDIGAYEGFISPSDEPGYCLDFDGSNDYLNVGTFSNFPLGNTITIECWIKPNILSGRQGIFSTRFDNAAGSFQLEVGIAGDGQNRIAISGVNTWVAQTGNDVIEPGEWTHIAYTRSGTGSGTHILYVNGEVQTLISDANYTFVDNTSNKVIGSGTNNNQFFNGKLDEMRVWTVVRTAAQIREHMYLSIAGTESGLIGYWQLAESLGSQAVDAINNNNGILNNMDNSDWVSSTIPFATGTSNSQTETNGVVYFTGTDLSMNFSTQNGAVITATKLETAPNVNPAGVDIVFDSQYWLVNRYDTGSFNTSLTFTITEDLLDIDQSIPSRIKLYTRPRNSDGAWSFLAEATSVDAVNNQATFSGITAFSQFMVCKNEEGGLPTFALIGNTPDFALITNNFNSIDVGNGSAPTFTDIDGDPFLDLLIGEYEGNINYYEQVSQNSYSFTLVNSNFNSIDIGYHSTPCITNFGEDNLFDLIVGEDEQNLNYYEQNSVNSTGFTLVTSNFVNSDVQEQHPTITDVDNDGLLDLIVGNANGILGRYEQNTINSTSFSLVTNYFSSLDVGNFASPVFTDIDDDDLLDLIIGREAGNLYHYEQNSPNAETFSLVSNNFQSIDIGDYARPTVKEIDNDLLLDLIIGEMNGSLFHYEQQETTSLAFNDKLVGCESTQSYHIRASALTGNLTVTCPDNCTVSLSSESGFGQSIEIVPVDGEIREEVFIRVVLPATGAYSGNISHTTAGASTKYIAVSANGIDVDNFPGKSLAFDGTNDYVNIADQASLDFINNYTLEAWIKPQAFTFLGGIVSKYHSAGANGFFLRLSGSSPYNGLDFDGKTTQNNILSAGQWYHIAAVNNNGTRTLYVNGEITALSGTPGTIQANDNPLRIGVDFLASARYFNGEIDEVRIWNVARTEAQIREFMYQAVTGDKSGLVGYWQLNEESGTQAPEFAKGNTGTLTNMDDADWVTSTAPLPFVSIAIGNWSNPATWDAGQGVPVNDWSRVRISSDVTLDEDKTVIIIRINEGGSLRILNPKQLTVTGN
jgi:predicted outer membrane repeat protein